MNSFWLCLIGFAVVIQTSTALQCYSCTSSDSGDCVNPDKSKLSACTATSAAADATNIFKDLASKIADVDKPNARPVCQKIIIKRSEGRFYERGCIVRTDNIDPCAELKKNANVEACELCDSDNCNSAMSSKNLWVPMIIMPALAVIFKQFV